MADTIFPAFLALVASKPAITSILGNRLFPIFIPQRITKFPSATYTTVSQQGNRTFEGASNYDFNNVDIHFYANTKKECDEIAEVFRKELEDESGVFEGVTINSVIYIDSGSDDFEDTIKKFTKQVELRIDTRR